MTDHSRFERRIGTLIEAYADRAPIDVDPFSMAQSARLGSRPAGPAWLGRSDRTLLVAGLVTALLAAFLLGAITAGSWMRQPDPIHLIAPRAFVEPFTGLPPDGAMPSLPETGELVVSFGGRVNALGGEFHRMWVYDDGRLLWKRNLEGSGASERAFGDLRPTTALIEQRLSSEGIARLRADVLLAMTHTHEISNDDMAGWGQPGVIWGATQVRLDDGRVAYVAWDDSTLPSRLADAWPALPATAWQDPRLGGFVPTRYAVCLEDFAEPGSSPEELSRVFELLPGPTKDVLRSRGIRPSVPARDARCPIEVTTADARATVATLREAGFQDRERDILRFDVAVGGGGVGMVEFLPIVPSGDVVCNCG